MTFIEVAINYQELLDNKRKCSQRPFQINIRALTGFNKQYLNYLLNPITFSISMLSAQFKFYLLFFTCLLLMGANKLYGHEDGSDVVIEEEKIADPKPLGDFDEVVIPLIRVQNLFIVEASVDGVTGNFVLDTGAPGLVLNNSYFDGGKLAEATAAYGVTGGGTPVYRYTVDSLALRSLHYKYIRADLANLGHLENARGVKILGLLGTNLFTEMEIELDLKNNTLKLFRTDKKGNVLEPTRYLNNQAQEDLLLPMDIVNDLIFVKGNCGKKNLKFCLDTGAEIGVMSNRVGNKVLDHFELTAQTTLRGSGNQKIKVLNGKLKKLEFEGVDFGGMPFVLTNLQHLESAYGTVLNGLLGYDFISKGRTVINFRKRTIKVYFY